MRIEGLGHFIIRSLRETGRESWRHENKLWTLLGGYSKDKDYDFINHR